jgi:IS1 family transposase
MLERSSYIRIMNKLSPAKRAQIVSALVEGNSIRATCRMTDTAKGTILKLLVDLGRACEDYQRQTLVNLKCQRIQCDEIWSFVGAKSKNVPVEKRQRAGIGDIWTWTALDADSKLIVSWFVGGRDAGFAHVFMNDVASRVAGRVQLTTDGHHAYLTAVAEAFDGEIDYAMLVKVYGEPSNPDKKYSPAECKGTQKFVISGTPELAKVSTSYVERQNLMMRMSMRRFTRLTNAFSKKVENHEAAVALHFMHYNFCRIHQTLRVTPAMAAGVADHVWEIEELIALMA